MPLKPESFTPKPDYYPQLQDLCDEIRDKIPMEFRHVWTKDKPTVFDFLGNLSHIESLRDLSLALFKAEIFNYQENHGLTIDPKYQDFITQFPDLEAIQNLWQDENIISKKILFQFGHDTAGNALWYFREYAPIGSVHEKAIRQVPLIFDNICYCYEHHHDNYLLLTDNTKANQERLVKGYLALMRGIAKDLVIPQINDALKIPIDMGNFELYELRSAYRELFDMPPLSFAEKFLLKDEVDEFIKKRRFSDKNLKLPVEVEITENSNNSMVFMDKGDLFRQLRNLLRDAVTHATGDVIKPIIQIDTNSHFVYLCIYSPGVLDEKTLKIIGREPYTTQDRGDKPHGYGKVGARKLITKLWQALGASEQYIENLLENHWANTTFRDQPYVVWSAPLPLATN